ncbi:hypothetical protein FM107_03535 [Sphingobacterium sp. JB170]|nr:hypothetical protein FM107_03535 [Sphingobacterium sp. JB170]
MPQNKIVEYKVTNIADEAFIYGSIDNDANTITVYIPYYLSIDVIDPEITVADGAEVEGEILPVSVKETGQTYTVTGSDGTKRTYTLEIVVQGPPSLSVEFLRTTDIANGYPNATITVYGDFYSYSAETLTAKLTNQETGEVFEPDVTNVEIKNAYNYLGYSFRLPIPAEATAGNYDVEIGFLGNTAKTEKPLTVRYRAPQLTTGLIRVKRGEDYVFNSQNNYVFLGLTKLTVEIGGVAYDLPIQSSDRTTATVKIPEDLPLGENRPGILYGTYSDWPDVVTHRVSSFTVEE